MKISQIRSTGADWHAWRGISVGSDLFDYALVLGWVTIFLSRQRISERLQRLKDALRKLEDV
jgi:hypothetical protein